MPNTDHYALVVGINDYTPRDKRGLEQLKGAVNDANAMYEWFTDLNGGNMPAENVSLVTSTLDPLFPDYTPLDKAFSELLTKAVDSGSDLKRFYFYFAGHGLGVYGEDDDNALCFVTWTSVNLNYALSARKYKLVLTAMRRFDEVIFFTDCCRNSAYSTIPMPPSFTADSIDVPGNKTSYHFLAYGTGNDEKTYEIVVDGKFRGLFTTVLIDGLYGAAANDKGEIDHDSLRRYLVANTISRGKDNDKLQKPDIRTNFDDVDKLVIRTFDLASQQTNYHFSFTAGRKNKVRLLTENAIPIEDWDPENNPTPSVVLRKGTYVLCDTITLETKKIIALPGKPEMHVEF